MYIVCSFKRLKNDTKNLFTGLTINLSGSWPSRKLELEDSQHQEINHKETYCYSQVNRLKTDRRDFWDSRSKRMLRKTQDGYLTAVLKCRIGHGADAFLKVIPHHTSQGSEVKDKDIPCHLIVLARLCTHRVLIGTLEWRR